MAGCRKFSSAFLLALFCVVCGAVPVRADNLNDHKTLVKSPLGTLRYFDKNYATGFFPGEVSVVENEEVTAKKNTEQAKADQVEPAGDKPQKSEFDVKAGDAKGDARAKLADPSVVKSEGQNEAAAPTAVAVRGNFKAGDLLPPNQDPPIRVEPDAPSPFFGLVDAYQRGDSATAALYADQLVRYQQRFFFELRALTQIIGESLIRQKQISEDDWDGVPQYLDYEFANARRQTNQLFKPTHETAMQRIKPDSRAEVEVYYFFNMNCAYCRLMAPDVERLYQAVKYDSRVKIVGLLMGPADNLWMQEYRNFTGLTLPVFEGEKIAKSFGVKFAPAIVVVTATGEKHAYLKSGKQTFPRMFEFVRRAQGLPIKDEEVRRYASLKIGEDENAKVIPGKNLNVWLSTQELEVLKSHKKPEPTKPVTIVRVAAPAKTQKSDKMEKF